MAREAKTMTKDAIHYESPIKLTFEDTLQDALIDLADKRRDAIISEEEKAIMTQVRMYVDVEKDELIKALAYDRGQYEKGYKDGYDKGVEDGVNKMFEKMKELLFERGEDNG